MSPTSPFKKNNGQTKSHRGRRRPKAKGPRFQRLEVIPFFSRLLSDTLCNFFPRTYWEFAVNIYIPLNLNLTFQQPLQSATVEKPSTVVSSQFDKENQSPNGETLCDPGFGTTWPSSLLFSASSNFGNNTAPPQFVSPNPLPPTTFALSPATAVAENNVASVASTAAATFNATEVRKLSTLNHLRTQHMNVLRNGRFVTNTNQKLVFSKPKSLSRATWPSTFIRVSLSISAPVMPCKSLTLPAPPNWVWAAAPLKWP